jgi:serine/threonine protein kinase
MALALNKSYCSGRYILRRRLDQDSPGAYGAVYLAEHCAGTRDVAVKESLAANETAKRRFERERRIQERLGGPHIVRVLGDDDFGSSRCLILEYMAGGSLAEASTRAGSTPEQTAAIVADVLRGLTAAHSERIIHRDLKPGNVLLDGSGRAKIADFGSAFDPSEPPLTRRAEILGTDDWMAPQQAAGKPPDLRDDIFAAGLLLYYLLTADRPKMTRSGWRPRLDQMDERYREIVRRATAEVRADRYPSAAAMLADLEQARGRPQPAVQRPTRLLHPEDLRLLTDAEHVRTLFRKLKYPVTSDDDFTSLSANEIEIGGSAAEFIEEGWTLSDLGDELFVMLLRLRDLHGSTIRRVAAQFFTRPADFLLVCTDTFDRFVFVNPRRATPGGTPRLHKLVVDRAHPTRHALDVLEQLACTTTAAKLVFQQQCTAFDVDRVTGRFYREYVGLLRSATERIRGWNRGSQMTYDEHRLSGFTQRLFSRILFLYFLQKKGWLAGQQDFLTRWYARTAGEDGNFFHDVLDPSSSRFSTATAPPVNHDLDRFHT